MAKPKNMMDRRAVHKLRGSVVPSFGMASNIATQATASTIMPLRTKMRVFLVSMSKTNPPTSTEIRQPIGNADDVMADRSDRGRQNPCWSTSLELVCMIGCRLANLIEASGTAAPTGRMDGSSQDQCQSVEKNLAMREASMDGPADRGKVAANS